MTVKYVVFFQALVFLWWQYIFWSIPPLHSYLFSLEINPSEHACFTLHSARSSGLHWNVFPQIFHFKFFQNQVVIGNNTFKGTNKFHWMLPNRAKCKYRINRGSDLITKYFQGYNVHYDLFVFYIMTFMLHERFGMFPQSCLKPRSTEWSSLLSLVLSPQCHILSRGLETEYFFSPITYASAVQWDTQVLNIKYMSNSIFYLHFTLASLVSC